MLDFFINADRLPNESGQGDRFAGREVLELDCDDAAVEAVLGQARTAFVQVLGEQAKILGTPLCLDCYDHDHHVVWNLYSTELWHRTKQNIERHLAARGITSRLLHGGTPPIG